MKPLGGETTITVKLDPETFQTIMKRFEEMQAEIDNLRRIVQMMVNQGRLGLH